MRWSGCPGVRSGRFEAARSARNRPAHARHAADSRDQAQRDDRLYQSLLLKAERTGGGGNVARAFRRAIDDATHIHGFIDWREVGTFAGNIDQVADSLAELLKPDTAATLVELAEYAIERLENSLEQIDDSNGEIGAIVCRLGELHLKACAMARPQPAGLAERLFRFGTTLPFGLCSFDAATYGAPLGKAGLRRYRELAEAGWRKIKPRDGKDSYAEAIKLLRKVGRLMKAQDQSRQFGDYLAELRVQFKPKRNFIKLLDELGRASLEN